MHIHFTIALILLSGCLHAQLDASFCGTHADYRYTELLRQHREAIQGFRRPVERTITEYPVTVHIIRKSDSTGGIDIDDFADALVSVNATLIPAGFSLSICGTIRFVNSDALYDYDRSEESSLFFPTRVPNTMNLYIANSVATPSGQPLCGYAYFPGWKDMVMLDRHCALDGSTFAHEIGHYFGLFHTHGNEVNLTDELVSGMNCRIAGDDVCDTPADPKLSWTVDSATCAYIGDALDDAGATFDPEPSNIMSYAPKHCKSEFTEGQYNRMAYVARYLRSYLACPQLSASFDVDQPVVYCPESQNTVLSYTGNGASSFTWDFDEDGSPDAFGPVADPSWEEPGTYRACLTASDTLGSITSCRDITIMGFVEAPFYFNPTSPQQCAMINPDRKHGWQIATLNENVGTVVLMDNAHYNAHGEQDHLAIGPVDISDLSAPALRFKIAYSPYSATREDALRVDVSEDCGETFTEIFYAHGMDLATTESHAGEQWMPQAEDDWHLYHLDLNEFTGQDVVVRLTNINGHGNFLYLADLAVVDQDPLPMTFLSFDVQSPGAHTRDIRWETVDEYGIEEYRVERSEKGDHFATIARVPATNKPRNAYTYKDLFAPFNAYYRITAVELDGNEQHSPIRHTSVSDASPRVFPNPASDRITVEGAASKHIRVFASNGVSMSCPMVLQSDLSVVMDISALRNGLYTVQGREFTLRFMKI